MARVFAQAAELSPDQRYCTHCEKPLRGRFVWLELNFRTGRYSDGGVDPSESQGWHPIGTTCAKKLAG